MTVAWKSTESVDKDQDFVVCNVCDAFYTSALPGYDVATVLKEKAEDDEASKELGCAVENAPEELEESQPSLSLKHQVSNSMAVQETYVLMTHSDVVETYKKTPQSLRLRAFTWWGKDHRAVTYYWVADPDNKRRLVVATALADVGERHLMLNKPVLFESQLHKALGILRGHTLATTMPPTDEDLRKRVESLQDELFQEEAAAEGRLGEPRRPLVRRQG